MFDSNLLFSNAVAVTADGNSSAISVNKAPVRGVEVALIVTAVDGTSPTLDATIHESDDNFSSDNQRIGTFPQITGIGRWFQRVRTKKAKMRLTYDVGGTSPSFTITAGIVPAGQRDTTA